LHGWWHCLCPDLRLCYRGLRHFEYLVQGFCSRVLLWADVRIGGLRHGRRGAPTLTFAQAARGGVAGMGSRVVRMAPTEAMTMAPMASHCRPLSCSDSRTRPATAPMAGSADNRTPNVRLGMCRRAIISSE